VIVFHRCPTPPSITMGCTGSKATPYTVCLDAYQSQKPIDINLLKQALTVMEPNTIDECKEPYSFSALTLTLLNSNSQPETTKLLLDAGAEMFETKSGGGFHTCPVGIALKYDRVADLEVMLLRFKEKDWDRLIAGVMVPPDVTGNGVGVAMGIWVWVRGQRAKTKVEVLGINTGKETTVIFDDETEATVKVEEIQPLPAVPANSKAVLIKVAEAAGCGAQILVPLSLLQDGTYGTMPRGWGTLAVLAGGGMALQLMDGMPLDALGAPAVGAVAALGALG